MSGLFFVNKTNSSAVLTRSKAEERNNILNHVQQRRRRRGEVTVAKERWTRYASYITFDDDASASMEEAQENEEPRNFVEPQRGIVLLTPVHPPYTYPTNNASDPFHCTVAGVDASTHSMLHYAFASFAKRAFLAEAFAPPSVASKRRSVRHSDTIVERLKRCVDDEMLMYSTLAYGCSALAWTTGELTHDKPPEYFIGHALQAVRVRLSSSERLPDTWLMLSIYALTITELWNGIPEMWMNCPARYITSVNAVTHCLDTSRMHLRALLHLVESAGGWQNVDPYVMESSILADKYLARSKLIPPIIPMTWDPGPLSKSLQHRLGVRQDDSLSRLGLSLIQFTIVPKLYQIIRDVIEYTRVAQGAWQFSEGLPPEIESWLFMRLQAISCRLLSLDRLQGTDNCIRITALIYLFSATEYHGGQLSALTTLQYLRSALVSSHFWVTSFDRDLLFWCLCTGALTSQPSHDRDWFVGMLSNFSGGILLTGMTEEAMNDRLVRYLFLAAKQEGQLRWLQKQLQV